MNTRTLALALAASSILASSSDAALFRYRLSGDWSSVTDGTTPGWGLNPNNDGSAGAGVPSAADDARVNWGGNSITVTTVAPTLKKIQIGVDESGTVVVANGGSLTTVQDILAGNNNSNATGSLTVQSGGTVNVGRILWAANNSSTGVIGIESGGVVNVASHLWWGVSGAATINISGTLNQTDGILGLGTSNASDPGGGTATVSILDGGRMNINNISGNAALPSIQAGSIIDISGSGQLTLPGDFVGTLTNYANANKLSGNGVSGLSNLVIDLDTNPGFTTVSAVPEPGIWCFVTLLAGAGFFRRRR